MPPIMGCACRRIDILAHRGRSTLGDFGGREDPEELEEEFGEIVSFASEFYERQDALLKTASYIRWETKEDNYAEDVTTTEVFSYDAEHGERHSCEKAELER